jgi:hypothetical protein
MCVPPGAAVPADGSSIPSPQVPFLAMVFGVLPFVMNFYFAFSTTLFLLVNTFINSFCKKAGFCGAAGLVGAQAAGWACDGGCAC